MSSLEAFHPIVRDWFRQRFGEPTEPQQRGWPAIAQGQHTLIAAPTGSGKTLASLLVCLDQLWRLACAGDLSDSIHAVYVSPLKALSNDIERNLQTPLAELQQLAEARGELVPRIRTAVRTGDTPAAERRAMLRRPPHILVTTPETLFILLTSAKSRELLRTVRTVIVDEIHALARDKRGSHLALSLERLERICDRPPVRVGLSATQRPIDEIARFLVGARQAEAKIIDGGHIRDLDLAVEVPDSDLSAVCSHEQWGEIYSRLSQLVTSHRSTLVFVNTRRLAERVGHHLRELLGEDAVASHHGSLSRDLRLSAERRLKEGQLKAIVATASLEMGIDIGYIDLVCQIGSPRSISAFLQRIGRSGHSLGATPKGRLFPLTRDELLECMSVIRAVKRRELDRIELPVAPLDILIQQVVAEVACADCDEEQLFAWVRRAWPYRELSRDEFDRVLRICSEGITKTNRRGAYLHRDQIHQVVRARRGARLAAVTSGGAIPDNADYRVVTGDQGTFVGTLNEDFALESLAGDVFLLGNTSWRIQQVRAGEVVVTDAEGAAPSIPFWLGEGLGRTIELSEELSRLRSDIAAWIARGELLENVWQLLHDECGASLEAAQQAVQYVAAQQAALGIVPTGQQVVFERFFDDSGGMQLVIHAPFGQRINRAWGLALRKRFCRSFDFELQAAATDNGVVLSLSPQHSFPIDALFKMLGPHNAEHLLQQAVLAQPMFQIRWRWNLTRSLMVLRQQNGKRVAPQMIRFRSDDLLAATFPETVGCLENHHGDVEIPDHPLVRQTMQDCLHEAMDVTRWVGLLDEMRAGNIELIARETREPSPFCHEILNANPYAFLDGAPLEERRTRAVSTRRSFTAEDVRDLAWLDETAIAQVREEAWPVVRDPEELHDALLNLGCLRDVELEPWKDWLEVLVQQGRATRVVRARGAELWIAAEKWPAFRAVDQQAAAIPAIMLPLELDGDVESTAALVDLVRARLSVSGPVRAAELAELLQVPVNQVTAALEAIEGTGAVLRGHFSSNRDPAQEPTAAASRTSSGEGELEWCDRRLLARIHRLTLTGLRAKIRPVQPADFLRFLARRHHVSGDLRWSGPVAIREAVALLEGFEAPAGAWERHLLAARVKDYESSGLDQLFLSGEIVWGRLRRPKRDDRAGKGAAAITRVVPLSLMLREDLQWLAAGGEVSGDRALPSDLVRGHSERVWKELTTRGALFFQELKALTELLPSHLDEALRELAAWGLITCDGFAAVRAWVGEAGMRSRERDSFAGGFAMPAGRWTCFLGDSAARPLNDEQRMERWCRLLLRRYGVVFRDLLTREACAPSWQELVRTLRRMELRGEVRGGRFISDVAGEQFADEQAVEQLREAREGSDAGWALLSASDPLNLSGIIDAGPRVPSSHRNALVLRDGHFVALKQAGQIEFLAACTAEELSEMRRSLQTGRREPLPVAPHDWLTRSISPGNRSRSWSR